MTKKATVLLITLCTGTALLTACAAKKPQTATLSLESNPTTGYLWECSQSEEIFNISQEYVSNDNPKNMEGVGGHDVFTLSPKEKGSTTVTFEYARPWEEESDDNMRIRYELNVDKNMQIEVESIGADNIGDDIETVPTVPQLEIK